MRKYAHIWFVYICINIIPHSDSLCFPSCMHCFPIGSHINDKNCAHRPIGAYKPRQTTTISDGCALGLPAVQLPLLGMLKIAHVSGRAAVAILLRCMCAWSLLCSLASIGGLAGLVYASCCELSIVSRTHDNPPYSTCVTSLTYTYCDTQMSRICVLDLVHAIAQQLAVYSPFVSVCTYVCVLSRSLAHLNDTVRVSEVAVLHVYVDVCVCVCCVPVHRGNRSTQIYQNCKPHAV